MLIKDITDWTGSAVPAGADAIGERVASYLALFNNLTAQRIANDIRDTAEESFVLYNANLNVGNFRTTGRIDITQYRSLYIKITPTSVGAALDNRCSITFYNSSSGGITQIVYPLRFTALTDEWEADLPVTSNYVAITCSMSTSITDLDVTIIGSRREQERVVQSIVASSDWTDGYYNVTAAALAVATSTIVTLPPWFGQWQFSANVACAAVAVPAGGDLIANVARWNLGVGWAFYHEIEANPTGAAAPAARRLQFGPTNIPTVGDPIRISWDNPYAAGNITDRRVRVTPVTGYLP